MDLEPRVGYKDVLPALRAYMVASRVYGCIRNNKADLMRYLPTARVLALALVIILIACANAASVYAAENQPLRVAVAADMRFAFEEIVVAFRKERPEIQVSASYGSSGNFYAQLSNRAPFDLFLSADVDYPRRLIREGRALAESEFMYGVGRIVLWVPQSSTVDVEKLGIQAMLDPSVRKIAIANPRYAPYGRAAEAAMKSLGVYEKVKDRLVLGDSIIQTAQFVESGAADIGIISHTLTLRPPLAGKGRSWMVPLDAYPRREQGGVILSWTEHREAAEALRAFVLSDKGKAILRSYGFSE
jgi:molybdate transport system substrate-binding protein